MSYPRIPLTCLLPCLFLVATSYAQWSQVGEVQLSVANHGTLVGHDGLLFASNDLAGIKRSTNGGLNWTDITNGIQEASAMGYDGTYLYVGSVNGIHRSDDNGDTWTLATGSLVLSSTNWAEGYRSFGGWFYVLLSGDVNEGGGIYRTNDHGATWTACNQGLSFPTVRVWDLVEKGGRLYCANGNAIHASDDLGATWAATHNWQITTINGRALATYGDRLIVSGTGFSNMSWSDDDGVTWQEANCPSQGSVYSSIEHAGNDLYALQYTAIMRSTDGGLNWTVSQDGMDTDLPYHLAGANGHLYCTAGFWLYELDALNAVSETPTETLDIRYGDGQLRIARSTDTPGQVRIVDDLGRVVLERRLTDRVTCLPFAPATGQFGAQIIDASGKALATQRFLAL